MISKEKVFLPKIARRVPFPAFNPQRSRSVNTQHFHKLAR
jgi:hypothetical protein